MPAKRTEATAYASGQSEWRPRADRSMDEGRAQKGFDLGSNGSIEISLF
ncbi:MAG TPA: hypothetical protein VF708_03980 [Pyrinomonadaceae bacterium]